MQTFVLSVSDETMKQRIPADEQVSAEALNLCHLTCLVMEHLIGEIVVEYPQLFRVSERRKMRDSLLNGVGVALQDSLVHGKLGGRPAYESPSIDPKLGGNLLGCVEVLLFANVTTVRIILK